MSKPVRLASFCRLCLTKTKDKVPVFDEGNLLENLLALIEIQIDPDSEPDAVVCYDCVVTLEGFHQFKEQCHVNDEFVKTIPPKKDNFESFDEEEEDEEDDPELSIIDEDGFEEEDRLELSEEEEVFSELPAPVKSSKSSGKNPKKAPLKKLVETEHAKPKNKDNKIPVVRKKETSKASLDELQVLQESYPDFFYFEKGSRSIYYTLVFYGERYNSAIFSERTTYWQCIHRKKYTCPAQVRVSNDYKTFERHYEHTHEQLREKEGQTFTPNEALPELFKVCKRIVEQKKLKFPSVKKETFESKFAEFAEESTSNDLEKNNSNPPAKRKNAEVNSSDSDAESEVTSNVPSKRKIKAPANVQPKKRAGKNSETITPDTVPETNSTDDLIQILSGEEEEELDLAQIEQECDALNVPKRPSYGPSLEDMQVLADSYPDYFFFEKGPRSVYFTLVYYGERFHSALFTERYTYWHCRHRRKYKCPAQVCVTNDYKTFERRYEHSHEALPDKEGQAFTPKEALPELFEACRKLVYKNRAKRRQKLLHKYQFLNSLNDSSADQPSTDSVDVDQDDLIEVINDDEYIDGLITKDLEYEELIEED